MARKRRLPLEILLDHAIAVFWDHGYRATSMDMLTNALRVAKPSIYANFGNKKALYLKALEDNHNRFMARVSHDLQKSGSALESLNKLISELMAPNRAHCRRGSLATNSALELADVDPEIRACLNKAFNDLLELFAHAIARGQQQGEIRNNFPASALAHFIFSSVQGIRIMEKTGGEMPHWDEITRLTLSALVLPTATSHYSAPQLFMEPGTAAGSDPRPARISQHRPVYDSQRDDPTGGMCASHVQQPS